MCNSNTKLRESADIKIGGEVKSRWYEFGEAIGVPKEYLDTLSGEESQCLKNVLDHWMTHHPSQPMWKEVVKAQRKIKLPNQFELKGTGRYGYSLKYNASPG